MPFQKRPSARRRVYLDYIAAVENALRDAYLDHARQTGETQNDIAARLGLNKSVISRRLNGRSNLSAESICDMAWAMGHRPRFALVAVDEAVSGTNHAPDPPAEAVRGRTPEPAPIKTIPLDQAARRRFYGASPGNWSPA